MSQQLEDKDHLDVVAVAPHPDDLELSCAGTLAMLVAQGYRVGMIDLTTGEPTPRGDEATRAREAEEARAALGVQVRVNLGLPNRVLMDSPEHRFRLATLFRRHRPSVVIVMAGRTPAASPDHHQGHLLVEAARFYSQLTKWDDRFEGTAPHRVPQLVYAPVPFDAEIRHWHSTFVVDITSTFEQKMRAVAAYRSQFDEKRLAQVQHFLTGWCISTGASCGFAYGELFALPHPVGTQNLVETVLGRKGRPFPPQIPGQDHLPQG